MGGGIEFDFAFDHSEPIFRTNPVRVLDNVLSVSVGGWYSRGHTMAITSDGFLWACA